MHQNESNVKKRDIVAYRKKNAIYSCRLSADYDFY